MQQHMPPERIPLPELVGRSPVAIDLSHVQQRLTGRRLLVTGAAGSIGQNLSELLLSFQPASLVLLDHHEHSLFQLVSKLPAPASGGTVSALLADVRDRQKLQHIYQNHRPEVIFHLAAYKHVHLSEENPDEVFSVNVLGTLNVVEEAVRLGAERIVYPSTDKAVEPCSVYGGTKRLVELLLGAMRREVNDTAFSVVRLVNTVGAYGGVIRVFAEQISQGRPITVTHPEMTRYWISMDEAIRFLALASCVDDVSGVLLLEMGEPVRLLDVARRLWGLLRPAEDLRISYVGLRAGERLHERVASDDETLVPTRYPGVLKVQSRSPEHLQLAGLLGHIALMKEQIALGDLDGLRRQIAGLVVSR